MNYKRKVFIDIWINLIITILINLLSFFNNKYFIQILGYENLGIIRLLSQFTIYLSLAELGLGTASTYILYKPLAEKDNDKIEIIFSTINSLYKKIAISIFFIGVLSLPLIKYNFFNGIKNFDIFWIIYLLGTSISYLLAKYIILFTADQNYTLVRLIQGIAKLLISLVQIYVIIKFESTLLYVITFLIDNLFQYSLFKYFFNIKYKKLNQNRKEKEKSIVKDLKKLIWHKISSLIVFNTDYIIISKFISLSTVGLYSSYMIVIQLIGTIISIGINSITPYIGKYIALNNENQIYILWKKLNIAFVFIGFVLSSSTFFLIKDFMILWLNTNESFSEITIYLIILNLFLSSTRWITEIFKNNSGYFEDIHVPILESLLNLIFSLILVKKIGINGVILGTIISNMIIIHILKPILVFQICFKETAKDYILTLINYIVLIFFSFVLVKSCFQKIKMEGLCWKIWIINAIQITILNFIIGGLIFLLNKDFREIIIDNIKKIKKGVKN